MTAARLLAEGRAELEAAGAASPGADARILLSHVLGVEPSALVLAGPPSPRQESSFRELVGRRCQGRPVQYLTGEAWFRGRRLAVGPGVFIPRPETELVAGAAIDECAALAASGHRPVAVDLCTGSGAVAAALAAEVPGAGVHAVELAPEALVWARRNLEGLGVGLHPGDALEQPRGMDGAFDVVVSNPPYLRRDDAGSISAEVIAAEPARALFSGADGLQMIRRLIPRAAVLLRPGGLLVMEHDAGHGESVPGLLADDGVWNGIEDHDDLTGRPRWVTARRA